MASTGRLEETDHLRMLGAVDVIDRRTISEPGKPLARERWAGAVDSVGIVTLENCGANILPRSRWRIPPPQATSGDSESAKGAEKYAFRWSLAT